MLNRIFKRSHLTKALQKQDLNLLLKAIRAGEELNQPFSLTHDGQTGPERCAIEHCVALQLPELLEKLLHAGATTAPYSSSGTPLLCQAIQSSSESLALTSVLLQAGYDSNIDDGEPLFRCLEHSDDNLALLLINRLLQYGADLNSYQRQQQSLLARLLQEERIELVGPLISSGALLPDDLSGLDCSESIKQFALRKAEDLRVQQLLQGG